MSERSDYINNSKFICWKRNIILSYPSSILSNEIASQLNRVWLRLTESEKQIVNYLTKQQKAVTLMQVLQEMPNSYSPEIILKAVLSLKRRCFLEDNGDGEKASLLRLDRIWESYVRSLNVLN